MNYNQHTLSKSRDLSEIISFIAVRRCCFRSVERTDGRTPDRYINPAQHSMRARTASIIFFRIFERNPKREAV